MALPVAGGFLKISSRVDKISSRPDYFGCRLNFFCVRLHLKNYKDQRERVHEDEGGRAKYNSFIEAGG